jgi:flagellar FliL protein
MTKPAKGKTFQVLTVVLLIAGCGIGYWMYGSNKNTASSVNADSAKSMAIVHLEPFVVNLADENEKDYLRVGMDLGVEAVAKEHKTETRDDSIPVMRDAIISVLSTRHSADLSTADGKQKLKVDLLKELNTRAAAGNVREIYFNEFLVQR